MEISSLRIESLRPDAHRLTLGVLWLTATAILILRPRDLVEVLAAVDAARATFSHIVLPTFVYGFISILAGVVLPYCLGEAFTPLGLLVMNLSLRLYRKAKPREQQLTKHAANLLMKDIGTDFVPPMAAWLEYVAVHAPRTARRLSLRRANLVYKASAILPACVILTWFCHKGLVRLTTEPIAAIGAVLFGVTVFVIAASETNTSLFNLNRDEALATAMIAARRLSQHAQGSAKQANALKPSGA